MTWRVTGTVSLDLTVTPGEPALRCIVSTTASGITTRVETWTMAYNLPDGMRVAVAVAYVDADGNPAVVDGPATWSSSDSAIATVTATGDYAAVVAATKGGTLGTAQITATADAQMGAGITNLLTTFDVTVVAGQAVAGTITPSGAPEAIP